MHSLRRRGNRFHRRPAQPLSASISHWVFARVERITRTGFTLQEQSLHGGNSAPDDGVDPKFRQVGRSSAATAAPRRTIPSKSALDCGACGGNAGKSERTRAGAHGEQTSWCREASGQKWHCDSYSTLISLQASMTRRPMRFEVFSTWKILPPTHRRDLHPLTSMISKEAGRRTSRERCARFPEIPVRSLSFSGKRHGRFIGGAADWSQVRPEWGLSGNAAFIIGRQRTDPRNRS